VSAQTSWKAVLRLLKNRFFSERHDARLYAGISDTVAGFQSLSSCYRQAAAAVQTAKHERRLSMRYEQLGIQKLLYAIDNPAVLCAFPATFSKNSHLRPDTLNGLCRNPRNIYQAKRQYSAGCRGYRHSQKYDKQQNQSDTRAVRAKTRL
jgi:hypothetical protein